jgi:hypothetical protein
LEQLKIRFFNSSGAPISNNTSDLDFLGLGTGASNSQSLSDNNNKLDNNLFGPETTDAGSSNVPAANHDSSKLTKDSIMALFNKPAQQSFQPVPVQQQQIYRPELNHNVSTFGSKSNLNKPLLLFPLNL